MNGSNQATPVSPDQGARLVNMLIEQANDLMAKSKITDYAFEAWEVRAESYLSKAFGGNSPNVNRILDANKNALPTSGDIHDWNAYRFHTMQKRTALLVGLREILETECQLVSGNQPQLMNSTDGPKGHKIFLVHGHDDSALQTTARFLEKLKQEVVILKEEPNKGRTIIEKFEDSADVGFAIVLLTADDVGGAADGGAARPRARQNVVFELGYFIGRLGRNRVSAIYVEGVELPSDYSGVLWTKLDEGGAWRFEIAKELKAAGFAIDLNLAV